MFFPQEDETKILLCVCNELHSSLKSLDSSFSDMSEALWANILLIIPSIVSIALASTEANLNGGKTIHAHARYYPMRCPDTFFKNFLFRLPLYPSKLLTYFMLLVSFDTPKNIRKPKVFWWFQGVSKETSSMKWFSQLIKHISQWRIYVTRSWV